MALDIYNTVTLGLAEATHVTITGSGADRLPHDETHLVLRSATRVAEAVGRPVSGWFLQQHNDIPLARGMGSSSAAIVGGLVAANELLAAGFNRRQLLDIAVAIEGHPDNVAPALLGGLTVCCMDDEGLGVARFDPPADLRAVLAIPDYEVSTEQARKVMPAQIPHADGVFNTAHAAAVLAALLSADMRLLGQAMKDRLHEPYRAPLVRGMTDCVAAAREAGAHAAALSGSGPTIVAFVTEGEDRVLAAMLAALRAHGVTCQGRVARTQGLGARLTK